MKIENLLVEKAKEDGIEKIVVGGVITNENNEVLILKRNADDFLGGIDELPSGKLEAGESIFEGLQREIKEETNLDIKKVVSYIEQFDYLSGSCKKCRQFNFKVEVTGGPILLTEHDSYKWMSLNDIENENNISPEVKHGLLVYKFNEEQKNSEEQK